MTNKDVDHDFRDASDYEEMERKDKEWKSQLDFEKQNEVIRNLTQQVDDLENELEDMTIVRSKLYEERDGYKAKLAEAETLLRRARIVCKKHVDRRMPMSIPVQDTDSDVVGADIDAYFAARGEP